MVSILEESKLKKLSTERLLALKRKVFKLVERHSMEDEDLYKRYYEEYIQIKGILNTREHVDRNK